MKIKDAIVLASKELLAGEQDDPAIAKFEAKRLLEYACDITPSQIITGAENELNEAQAAIYFDFIKKRKEGQPVAYIVGEVDFWSLRLAVNASTLIPRSDTETLVEWALALELSQNASVLDLGTGTGAIALALKKERPNWSVVGIDRIPEAVALAKRNAALNNLDCEFKQSNWFNELSDKKFKLIVSNPPYVEGDSEYLQKGDLRFEPNSALIAENNGLEDIETIITQASPFLENKGWLLIEHGHQQAKAIQALFTKAGFDEIETKLDLNGLARVTGAQLNCEFAKE